MGVISWSSDKTDCQSKMFSSIPTISLGMITMVQADHGGQHHDYYAKPYYNFEYGVEAYGVGYGHGGHGDPGPLPYKHTEHRDGYDTKGQFQVQLPGNSYHRRDYSFTSRDSH